MTVAVNQFERLDLQLLRSPGLGHALLSRALRIRGQVLDLLALWLAALAAVMRMLRPRASVAAPPLTRVQLLCHGAPLLAG
ncbi:MAG: hypothetical protein ACRENL_00065 [Candidatus Dormibacteria bacterium]